MSNPQQMDMNQQASISMSLFQWNGVLMLIRTGNGPGFTWENTNPLVQAITQQLQAQMYQPAQSRLQQGIRPNGEDEQPQQGQDRDDNARVEKGRTPERF